MILMAILAIVGSGDLIFLGVVSQTILNKYNPAFYWWGVAGYIAAGVFALWFICELTLYLRRKRRKKAIKTISPAVHQRGKRKSKSKKRSKK